MSSMSKAVKPLADVTGKSAAKTAKATAKFKNLAIMYGAGDAVVSELAKKMSEGMVAKTDDDMMALYAKTHPEEFVVLDSIAKENGMDAKIFDLSQLKTAKCVPLMEATHLYQPVDGTSSGSRYFALAIGKNLRLAGRWQASAGGAHGLALRVEGPGLDEEETKALIVGCGLDFKSSTHASVHLSAESEIDIRKAVGALLLGLDEEWETVVPNPHVIQGI